MQQRNYRLYDKRDEKNLDKKISSNKYVTRYRRTRNLIKRVGEISNQCDLEMILVMYDRKNNYVREVHTNRNLTLDTLNNMVTESVQGRGRPMKYKRESVLNTEDDDDDLHLESGEEVSVAAKLRDTANIIEETSRRIYDFNQLENLQANMASVNIMDSSNQIL